MIDRATFRAPHEDRLARSTAAIIARYVSVNQVAPGALADLVRDVRDALQGPRPAARRAVVPPTGFKPTPDEIRDSIQPDALISFINSQRYQMLKRHLRAHGLTFHDYRMLYGLPADYPTTAPAISEKRRVLARARGLGLGRGS